MKQLVYILMALLFACTSAVDKMLKQPPYAALTDSIAEAPRNAALYYHRGLLLQQSEQHALAEKDFSKAWSLQPAEDYAIGKARYLIGRNWDSAVLFLEDAVAKVPQSLVLQVSLARGYQQQKRFDKAIVICNQIIADYPNQLDALLLKASLLKTQNRTPEAVTTLEQAYYYAPFDAELVHTLAFDYAEAKNPKVITLADSLLRADSLQRHAEPFYFKGIYYSNTGNNYAALQQFDEAIRRDYNFLDAHMEKGVLLYEMKQYTPAQKSFELAATVSPSFADAYLWLGKVAQAQQRLQEAKEQYLRAYSLDKNLAEAKAAADAL